MGLLLLFCFSPSDSFWQNGKPKPINEPPKHSTCVPSRNYPHSVFGFSTCHSLFIFAGCSSFCRMPSCFLHLYMFRSPFSVTNQAFMTKRNHLHFPLKHFHCYYIFCFLAARARTLRSLVQDSFGHRTSGD